MAIVVARVSTRRFLRGYEVVATGTFSGTYPTGGEQLNAGDVGLTVLDKVVPIPAGGFTMGVVPQSPDASGTFTAVKLPIFDASGTTGTPVEVSAGAYPSYVTTPNGGIVYFAVTGR